LSYDVSDGRIIPRKLANNTKAARRVSGGTYMLHLQGIILRKTRNSQEVVGYKQSVTRRFGGSCCLHPLSRRISHSSNWRDIKQRVTHRLVSFSYCLVYSSTLKMDPMHSSETSTNFYRTIGLHIPEGSASYVCKLKTYKTVHVIN
jgi:hypothetical protein